MFLLCSTSYYVATAYDGYVSKVSVSFAVRYRSYICSTMASVIPDTNSNVQAHRLLGDTGIRVATFENATSVVWAGNISG